MSAKSNETKGNLTARQEKVAAALASGSTKAQASRECRVSTVTIWVWMKQPAFKERIEELRKELNNRVLGLLAEAAATAVLTLRNVAESSESEPIKVDAADRILKHHTGSRQQEQLDKIEERLDNHEAQRKPK